MQLSDKLESLPAVVCARVRRFVEVSPAILPSCTPVNAAVVSVGKQAKKISWATSHTNVNLRTGPMQSKDSRIPPPPLSSLRECVRAAINAMNKLKFSLTSTSYISTLLMGEA